MPEYTMQAVVQQTGVPPDTLRSWERRHGFPAPARSGSNRRLYSERDIAAVQWLRDQTGRGQGTSEAVQMLLSRMSSQPVPTQDSSSKAIEPTPVIPLEILEVALAEGRMADAQSAWDHIAIAVSPDALGNDVILPMYHHIRANDISHHVESQVLAFLARKATVLLDHAGPDPGTRTICIASVEGHQSNLPATVLAAALSRNGFRIYLPILDAADVAAVDTIGQLSPDIVVLVSAADAPNRAMTTFARMLSDQRVYGWSSSGVASFPDSVEPLPVSPIDASLALR